MRDQTRESPRIRRLAMLAVFVAALIPILGAELYVRATRRTIALMEVTGRVARRNPDDAWAYVDAFAAYRARPGQHWVEPRKTANRHGFISTPEIDAQKAEGTVRIAFLGGSSTAGPRLSDEETYPWIATELIRRALPESRFDFINAALFGYTTFESYGRLWGRLRFFHPDIVIVSHGWNEMYYFNQVDSIEAWRVYSDGSWGFHRTVASLKSYEPLWLDHLIWPSQFLTRIRLRLSPTPASEVGVPKRQLGYDPRGLEIFRSNLRLIRETSALINARLYVAKQPTLIVADLPDDQRKRAFYGLHGFGHDEHVQAFADIYRVIDEEIPPNQVIDLTSISGSPEAFVDHIHPTRVGAARIAEVIAETLIADIRAGVLAGAAMRP